VNNDEDAEYIVSINAFSKSMAMTGWRLGYLVTTEANVKALSSMQSQMVTCAPGFIQEGAVAGFADADKLLPGIVDAYRRRLKLITDEVATMPGLRVLKPSGAFYAFVDVSKIMRTKQIATDYEFAERLFHEQLVAVVSGSAFGMPGWIRLSFATSDAEIKKGLSRLRTFCESTQPQAQR
jgi:aspartate aminotransferase